MKMTVRVPSTPLRGSSEEQNTPRDSQVLFAYADWELGPVHPVGSEAEISRLAARLKKLDPLSRIKLATRRPDARESSSSEQSEDSDAGSVHASESSGTEGQDDYVPDMPEPMEEETRTPSPIEREEVEVGGFDGPLVVLYSTFCAPLFTLCCSSNFRPLHLLSEVLAARSGGRRIFASRCVDRVVHCQSLPLS